MSLQLKIGVFISKNGKEDKSPIDYQAVADYAKGLPKVEFVTVFESTKKLDPLVLAEEFRSAGLNRIVIAGVSPGYFKPAFNRAMAEAGKDPDEVKLASFREHGSGLEGPTDRSKAILACAVFGVPFGLAAVPENVPVNPATLIIGGGVGGIQAALEIADAGYKVYLVERQGTIGGHMAMGWATDNKRLRQTPLKTIAARYKKAGGFKTKYWSPEVHVAAFALPRFIQDLVDRAKVPPSVAKA